MTTVNLDATVRTFSRRRSRAVEGYCSSQSVEAGQKLQIMVSTAPARRFHLEVFRMGYYRGVGARRVAAFGPVQGRPQPEPRMGPRRLVECSWRPTIEFTIPQDWRSGVYLGRLTIVPQARNEPAAQSYVVFVVRDRRRADILVQVSDNTWQAYNPWPANHSLYTDPRHSWAPGVAVSFDRPHAIRNDLARNHTVGSGEFLVFEYPLTYWLEQNGYDVTYCSNVDMLDAGQPLRAKAFLSVGHDEYWDVLQYQTAIESVRAGVNHLYLSGNSVFGVTPFQPSSSGVKHRVLSREGVYGGIYGRFPEFFEYPFPMKGPSAQALMGVHTTYPFDGSGDWVCTNPSHWVYRDTGMKRGDRIPGLIGWEAHGDPARIPGLEVIAEGDVINDSREASRWASTIYPGPKGNFVFSASSMTWVQGLAAPPGHVITSIHGVRSHGPDGRVQTMLRNLLKRATA